MLIKYILIISLTLVFLYFIKNANKIRIKAWKRIFFSVFLIFGIIAIIFPNIVDALAKKIGIGRGTDLLLYVVTVSFIFVVINIYIKFKEISLKQNKIISKMAILEGDQKNKENKNI